MRSIPPVSPAFAVCLALFAGAAACSQHRAEGDAPATGPASASSAAAGLGDTIRVMRGQRAAVDGGRLTVRFDSAATDSRCPRGVQCVWAGDAAVPLRLDADGATTQTTLHTTLEPHAVTHRGYHVTLLDLTPYPGTEPPNARLAQVAVLTVTRP